MKELKGKVVTVVGLGKSGLGSIKLLLEQGADVRASDQRSHGELGDIPKRLQGMGLMLYAQTPAAFLDANLIVLSPGVPADAPELADARVAGTPIIGEAELASFFLKGPVLGITGSNGKTTTTALTGHVLNNAGIACQVGGNIGVAPTAMIETSRDDQWNVLELSSFQLETIHHFSADIAVCLNVTPDHLDRHGTLDRYADAKARLFETQRANAHAVLNADDKITAGFAGRTQARVHWFRGSDADGGTVYSEGESILPVHDIPMRGAHNVQNTMAAALASRIAGATPDKIAAAVRSFGGVEHRLEFVREHKGVRWYNDSKATNVDATEKAIEAFDGNLWVILGGKDKNSDYSLLYELLKAKAHGVLLIGAAAGKIADQLPGLPLHRVDTLEGAVEYAARSAREGDTVLLAPACASFDQFRNYEHRGQVFKELVRSL